MPVNEFLCEALWAYERFQKGVGIVFGCALGKREGVGGIG